MSVFMTLWWSVCVCAWLAAGAPSPTSVQQEDDEAPGYFHETVEEYCTCRCDGCFWQNTCRNNGEHVQKEVCEANQGTWCSCAQQAILLAAAAKSNYSTFQADIPYVGGGEAVGGGEKAPSGTAADTKPPHIVFVLADDIGYNDLSWRNPFAQTPTLQKLRDGGVELTSYYTQSMCSPSRAALATGRYPMRYGMQSYVLLDTQPWGLPLSEVTLAQQLRSLFGYETQHVGKWHLGAHTESHTPLNRGFDGFFGSFGGMQTYKSHVSQGGFDFRNGSEPYFPAKGVHTHDLVLERVRWILDRRKQSSCGGPDDGPTCHEGSTAPLFLMLALQSPHCPLDEVPERYLLPYREHFRELLANESVAGESFMQRTARVSHLALVTYMDEVIARVISMLQAEGYWDNLVFVFSSDNGGCATGHSAGCDGGSSNFPFRGGKSTIYEGGVRGTAVMYSTSPALLPESSRGGAISTPTHIVDFFPTIMNLVARKMQVDVQPNTTRAEFVDGRNLLPQLLAAMPPTPLQGNTAGSKISGESSASAAQLANAQCDFSVNGQSLEETVASAATVGFSSRNSETVVLSIDPFLEGAALRHGRWKLIARPPTVKNGGWSYNVSGGMSFSAPSHEAESKSSSDWLSLTSTGVNMRGPIWELYDLETDQREEVNLADRCPNVLATMRAVLKGYEASANILSPFSIPHDFKAATDVLKNTGAWGPFTQVSDRDYYYYPKLIDVPDSSDVVPSDSTDGRSQASSALQWLWDIYDRGMAMFFPATSIKSTNTKAIVEAGSGRQMRISDIPSEPHFHRADDAPKLKDGALVF